MSASPPEREQQITDLAAPLLSLYAAAGHGERHPARLALRVLGAQREPSDDMPPERLRILSTTLGGCCRSESTLADADQPEGARGSADVGDGKGEVLPVGLADPPLGDAGAFGGLLDHRGIRALREVLGRPFSHGPIEVTDAEAAGLTETYRTFLDVIGDGVTLTSAGYLPPAVVEQVAERSGISDWWIGRANREDLTPPVAVVRNTARALGLVSVRTGRLSPTAAAIRCGQDPQALWRYIVGRLPLGTKDAERQAGWMALAVAGSGVPAQEWRSEISDLLFALGWRSGSDRFSPPPANSLTLEVLEQLAGASRVRWREITGLDFAVAATARAVIRGE